jgi:hypothetical protein
MDLKDLHISRQKCEPDLEGNPSFMVNLFHDGKLFHFRKFFNTIKLLCYFRKFMLINIEKYISIDSL